jgi:hypothetical protein
MMHTSHIRQPIPTAPFDLGSPSSAECSDDVKMGVFFIVHCMSSWYIIASRENVISIVGRKGWLSFVRRVILDCK